MLTRTGLGRHPHHVNTMKLMWKQGKYRFGFYKALCSHGQSTIRERGKTVMESFPCLNLLDVEGKTSFTLCPMEDIVFFLI